MMGNGIAGAVILFNPAEDVFGNIESYAPFVKLLIVIDNSPSKNHALADKIKGSWNSVIIANGENLGLAAALNQAASIAREKGFEWLLTMDQDSRFEQGAMLSLEKAAFEHKDAGILSPVHVLVGDTECDGKAGWTPLRVTMTSGNLLNLGAYGKAGPFLEMLFIDYVDHEYCLRLASRGFQVRRINDVFLRHSLGNLEARKILGLKFHPTHHSPLRRYYMTRNRLYVMRRYPSRLLPEALAWAKEIVKLFFFENNKRDKVAFMLSGANDFFRGKFGPYTKSRAG